MGRATVISHEGEGLYRVNLQFKEAEVNTRIAEIDKELERLNEKEIADLLAEEERLLDELTSNQQSLDNLIIQYNDGDLFEDPPPSIIVNAGDFLDAVNTARSNAGAGSLSYNSQLNLISQTHAYYLAGTRQLNHYGEGARGPETRARDVAYDGPALKVGELLNGGARTIDEAVNGWLRWSNQTAILTDPDFVDAGFGFAQGDDAYRQYWVFTLGRRVTV